MATADVQWDWFVFKMKAYQYIVNVTKFELPSAYRFSKAEGRTSLWEDSAPLPGLFRVKIRIFTMGIFENRSLFDFMTI